MAKKVKDAIDKSAKRAKDATDKAAAATKKATDRAAKAAKEATDKVAGSAKAAADRVEGARETLKKSGEKVKASGEKIAKQGSAISMKMIEHAEENTHQAFAAMRAAAGRRILPRWRRFRASISSSRGRGHWRTRGRLGN